MPLAPNEAQPDGPPAFKRPARLLVPVALAVLLFGLLVWPGLASIFGTPFRLSTILSYKAFNPDIAAAGNYVAAVWSEGYNAESGTKQFGNIYLKSADTTNGWEGRIRVFTATASEWGRDPRVVFDPSSVPPKVHVIWAQASGCPNCNWSSIRRTTCLLAGADTCVTPSTPVVTGRENALTPDLAVDTGGNAHMVWREGPGEAAGNIMYCKGSCGTSPNDTGQDGQHPALAFAGTYLHLVWDSGSQPDSTIRYARENQLGNGTWEGALSKQWWNAVHPSYYEPSYPAIGASGSAVYVVWALQNRSEATEYALAFDFSQNTGQNWAAAPSVFGRSIPENETAAFTSTWFAADQPADELYGLQPDVVATGDGASAYAHVVWHGKELGQGTYEVRYSYLPGIGAPDWAAPELVATDRADMGLPAVAIGAGLNDTHVAFAEDADASSFGNIDVWYAGAIGNRDQDSDVNEGRMYLPILLKYR